MEQQPVKRHAHDLVGGRQLIYWTTFGPGDIMEFELIDYFQSQVYRKSRGEYHIFYAIALTPFPAIDLKVGDEVILFLPFRSLIIALNFLSSSIRIPCLRKYAEGKNLYIKLERVNQKTLKVYHEEVREPTEEQLLVAKQVYEMIDMEHKPKRSKYGNMQ